MNYLIPLLCVSVFLAHAVFIALQDRTVVYHSFNPISFLLFITTCAITGLCWAWDWAVTRSRLIVTGWRYKMSSRMSVRENMGERKFIKTRQFSQNTAETF